jgi:Uncharacterized conserved protein
MKPGAFDEMVGFGEGCRPCYEALKQWLDDAPADLLDQRRKEAELLFRRIGITFAVYGEQAAQERLIPFDIIPHPRGRRMAQALARARAAGEGAQRLSQGRLRQS